jgi:hypothetical protein
MFREWKEKEYIPKKQMVKLFIRGSLSLSKVLIKNFFRLKNLRKGEGINYTPPERVYDLPSYSPDMKFIKSDEKYLRPTLFCNPYSPEIIAMANKLGAFEKEPYEYSNDVFEFVKRKVTLQIVPFWGVEETLRKGYGTCIHKISLFIALCRVAGIRARYKLYALSMIPQWYDTFISPDPLMVEWYDAMGNFLFHGEGEAYIDGKWIVGDVGPLPERQAATGIPITKFGEDSIGIWFEAIPGGIMRTESIPLGLATGMNLLLRISPATVAKINNNVLALDEKGRKILQEIGEEEYDKRVRKTYKMPKIELEKKSLIFE